MAKKVIYGLRNLYYAVETDTGAALTYGNPVAWPGSVNWTCTPRVDDVSFEADDDEGYFRSSALKGFDISIEAASVPEAFETDVLGAVDKTADGTLVYNGGEIKRVALMIRRTVNIDGTEVNKDLVIYHCLPSIPAEDGETSGQKQPKTKTITFKSDRNPYTGATHAKTKDTPVSSVQSSWYTSVYTG